MAAYASFTEVEGQADGFQSLPDEPFYRFQLNTDKGRIEVHGPERILFEGKTISPAFREVDVDWAKRPTTKVYGRKESPTEMTAYIVHVEVGDSWRCWSYRPVIDNRALGLLARYKKLSASEPEVKDFWFVGSLAGCDLLSVMRNVEGKPVEVPEEVLDREALVRATLKGQAGEVLEPLEIYVKEGERYRRL